VGQAVRIAVDPNGKAWVVNSSGGIFRWIDTSWQNMPGKAIDIGIGSRGEVWVLDPNGTPFKWDGNNWRAIGGGGWRIAVDPNGNPIPIHVVEVPWPTIQVSNITVANGTLVDSDYQLGTAKKKPVVQLIDTHGFATDATVSPAGGLVAYRSAAQAGGKIVSAENAWKKFFLNLIFVRQVAAQHSSLAPQM